MTILRKRVEPRSSMNLVRRTSPSPSDVNRLNLLQQSIMEEGQTFFAMQALFALMLIGLSFRRIFLQRQFAHRKRNNLCAHCGYDLRASIDRCPECGQRRLSSRRFSRVACDCDVRPGM